MTQVAGGSAGRLTARDVLATQHRWYHTIDLEPGVATPGWCDLRDKASVPPIPKKLKGKRALDCGTFDGFWAFELERRGAEVVAIDIDEIPPPDAPEIYREETRKQMGGVVPGTGFKVLKEYFGSSVTRVSCNVYDVRPDVIGGPVDLAFMGALLLHLRDPIRALESVRKSIRPGGTFVSFEPVSDPLEDEKPAANFYGHTTPWTFWYPNKACLLAWLHTAGFRDIEATGETWLTDGDGVTQHLIGVRATA
ncbi:MAG: class I SAM-dependent methyltransferase [Actinomycetes bacterium]